MNDAAGDVQLFGDQCMNAGARVVNAAARRFVAIEARKASCRRIRVNKSRVIDEAVVAEPTETLQESPIDWPNSPICADTKIIRSRARVAEKLKLVTALMVGAEEWAAVTLRRIAHREPNGFVLWKYREIEIAKLRARVVTVVTRDWIRRNAESCRREYPVRIRKIVQVSEILKSSIASLEPIPLRFLDINPHRTIRIGSPTTRSY